MLTGGESGPVTTTLAQGGGLYASAWGGQWSDPQTGRLLTPASVPAEQNAYNPHVTLFGSEWLGSHAGLIAGVAEAGIGITITVATAGLLAPAGAALTASGMAQQ